METTTQQLEMLFTASPDPKVVDQELADLFTAAAKASRTLDSIRQSILGAAGAKYYYRGRNRVTDMKLSEARPIVEAALEGKTGYTLLGSYTIRSFDGPSVIERHDAAQAELASIRDAINAKQDEYTGWSRFFLVTSSSGHIHSSMDCSTCYRTTTYGWLPALSGETEADAVAEHGEVLCSVCFPSAPVAWTGGKVSKAQAERKAANQ